MQLKAQCFSNWGIVGAVQVTRAVIPSLLLGKKAYKGSRKQRYSREKKYLTMVYNCFFYKHVVNTN